MSGTKPIRSGHTRLVLAAGAALVSVMMATAAAVMDTATVDVTLDGSRNRFDIVVQGSTSDGWKPDAASWAQGNPTAYEISLAAGKSSALAPGASFPLTLAVRNSSPTLAGVLSFAISDPTPRGDAVSQLSGHYLELYDQLVFTVTDDQGTVVFDHVPAARLTTYTWPDPFQPGAVKLLHVLISLPERVDNRWQGASTDIQFHFEAENV